LQTIHKLSMMRQIILIFLLSPFFVASCQTSNINFKDAIESQQTVFPNGQDKKWKAIKDLGVYKDDVVCDTLFSIYMSIDTSKRGFGMYYDVIFNTLVNINTPKSAKTIEKIYTTKLPKFLSQSSIINLGSHKNYELLFPGILRTLEPDILNSRWILELLYKGLSQNKISKSQLESYLPLLSKFYQYTKAQRDKPEPKDGLILNIYYWVSNPKLSKCLAFINDNSSAKNILLELFNDSKDAKTIQEKELSWETYKALDSTFYDYDFLTTICRDIEYRNEVYIYFKDKNKLNLFPTEHKNQQSLCEMICVSSRNLRRHDTNKPGKISYIGVRKINSELYYFYWICWRDNCESNSVVVVGPQPIDKTNFNDNPKLKGESIKEKVNKSELQKTIAEFKPD
jgi:hypothetical protein